MELIPVMIVDDDYLVVNDLKTLVNWRQLGFQVVATAGNGESAYQLYKKHKPQLIISDLQMPVMDGMDLVEKIRMDNPDVRFLLVSAYENFHYAKRAMKADVEDYLLKNELTEDILTEKLSKLVDSLNYKSRIMKKSYRTACGEYMVSKEPTEVFLHNYIYEDVFRDKVKKMIYLPLQYYLFTFRRPVGAETVIDIKSSDDRFMEQLPVIEQAEAKYSVVISFCLRKYLLMGLKLNQEYNIEEKAGRYVQKLLEEGNQKEVLCYYPDKKIPLTEFRDIFHNKAEILEFYNCFSPESIMSLAQIEKETAVDMPDIFKYRMLNEENVPDGEDYGKALDNYVERLFLNKDISKIHRLYNNLLLRYEEISNYQIKYETQQCFHDKEDFLSYLKTEYERCLENRKSQAGKEYSNIVKQLIRYIDQHYEDPDLSVETLAVLVKLSTGRISFLFKEETGKTINDYLTEVRIDKAIYLLKHSNLKIYEIAKRVGYRTSQYFSKVFGKNTGRRPNDYR